MKNFYHYFTNAEQLHILTVCSLFDNLKKNERGTHMKNQVTISGKVTSINFSHELLGEKFYLVNICVERLSGSTDDIPAMVSDRLIHFEESYVGKYVTVSGQFRSYNQKYDEGKKKLVLFVFAEEIMFGEQFDSSNTVSLDGYICKQPTFRQTPFGRQISDVLIAVNRSYGKSDYIPCIIWGRNARFASSLNVGDVVHVFGRIQSREYLKDGQTLIAYEVSTQSIEKMA